MVPCIMRQHHSQFANGRGPNRSIKSSIACKYVIIILNPFQAYVSKQRPVTVSPQIRGSAPGGNPQQLTGFARLRHSLAISPALPRRAQNKEPKVKDENKVGRLFFLFLQIKTRHSSKTLKFKI